MIRYLTGTNIDDFVITILAFGKGSSGETMAKLNISEK